jgi:hypothetical protein
MKTNKLILRLAAATAMTVATCVSIVACSGDDSNSTPTNTQDAGNRDTGNNSDTGTPDTGVDGSCESDASNCNSCVTPDQDRFNACSQYAVYCIPFDNSTVPQHPAK